MLGQLPGESSEGHSEAEGSWSPFWPWYGNQGEHSSWQASGACLLSSDSWCAAGFKASTLVSVAMGSRLYQSVCSALGAALCRRVGSVAGSRVTPVSSLLFHSFSGGLSAWRAHQVPLSVSPSVFAVCPLPPQPESP